MHVDALAFRAASLALPTRATEKVLVYIHDLYCTKFALEDNQTPTEDLQVKEALETSTVQSSGIGNSYTVTTPCTGYYPMTPKRRPLLKGSPLDSITM